MIVSPKKDCPHIQALELYPLEKFKTLPFHHFKCEKCTEESELWICLTCSLAFCGRYINNHFKAHFEENPSHCICLSILDLSVWCYNCETEGFADPGSYIESALVFPYIQAYSDFKFGSNFHPSSHSIDSLLTTEKCIQLKYTNFIELLKNRKFTRIVLLTGAGISTSAGIPDFRSNTGLFKNVIEKFNVKSPEDFFCKELFKTKPELFYSFCKGMDFDHYSPTRTHFFIRYLMEQQLAKILFTQNIDGLEIKAGIDQNKIVFAHGTTTLGHCSQCNEPIDINEIKECVKNGLVKYCPKCGGPCKPRIVLFGENLPNNFYESMHFLQETDLVIIMGTSLKVEPFASLTDMVDKKSWIVVINREKVGNFNYNNISSTKLFLEGTCDDVVKQILEDCGWWDDFSHKYNI